MKQQSSQPYFPHVLRSGSLEATNSRSNSVLRLKKNSNFKITLGKPKQESDANAAPSLGDFKRMLKATKGFAPRIRYSHINSNEVLELVSQPGRALSGVGYRPNQINTFRPAEESTAENFGHYTKRSVGKSRESSPGSKMSPRNTMYLSKYSSHGGDSIFNISPSPQEKNQRVVKLRKNGFIPDLRYELDRPISFNNRIDKDILEEPRGRLKPYKVSDKFYLESFVMKDYANKTTQELLGTYRSPQSGGVDSLFKDSTLDQPPSARNSLNNNNSPQKFLSRRTASISGLRSASTTKLEVETVQQPIQQMTGRELLEAHKTRQYFNTRKKLIMKPPTVITTISEKKMLTPSPNLNPNPTPENGIIHSPTTARTLRSIDQSPTLKAQNYNDTRYALKTLRTLRSLGGGLNGDIDGRSPSPLKNKSTLQGFQVSVIEDSESHFHDHSFNKIHLNK